MTEYVGILPQHGTPGIGLPPHEPVKEASRRNGSSGLARFVTCQDNAVTPHTYRIV